MSFVLQRIELKGTHHSHQFKFCGKCEAEKPPEGGIDMGQKWICASCWTRRATGSNLKNSRKV
jgi:hypothetical protein